VNLTRHTLKKIEHLFEEAGYEIIYEKGQFTSGYCLVEHQRKLVINKFYDVEGRIQAFLDLFDEVKIDQNILSPKTSKTYLELHKLKHK
jgi:hypothetical protein